MSLKNRDNKNRWRNKTVAFRVSPEEDEQIETAVRLSGLTKQDYITRRLMCREVVVQGNPRVYKALRNEFAAVLVELQRIEAGVKRIRIHDLRHSHISLLIDMGFTALAIADRVGHESIDITYRYAHLFPTRQTEMADRLDMERKGA